MTPPVKHQQWEYHCAKLNLRCDYSIVELLNDYGKEGWEAFNIRVDVWDAWAYFKRPLYEDV